MQLNFHQHIKFLYICGVFPVLWWSFVTCK